MSPESISDLENRRADSARKIQPPFQLDPTLCLYSPQANRDALNHPRVKEWLTFITEEWEPETTTGRRVALFLPCTAQKPYSTSNEHLSINSALIEAGWEPQGDSKVPSGLLEGLPNLVDSRLLHEGPLRRGDTWLDRIVVSEPLALVPYSYLYAWRGTPTVSTSYDDYGLFESRGIAVTPERPDSTAIRQSDGTWRWGPEEHQAYAEVHNALVDVIARVIARVGERYDAIGAWVSPELTHRSFLSNQQRRAKEGIPNSRLGPNGTVSLRGVGDLIPGSVAILPTIDQLTTARASLASRLEIEGRSGTPAELDEIFAGGDGTDSPLGLPETLQYLTAWLNS